MERTHNPFANLAALILGTLFLLGVGYGVLIAMQRGLLQLPPAKLTIDNQQPALRPTVPPFRRPPVDSGGDTTDRQPGVVPTPAAPAQPQDQPQAAPEPTPWQAPGVASPGGAPMTEEYQQTINNQQRTNDQGEVCMPRSGCTKPGSGGPLAWPNGRP